MINYFIWLLRLLLFLIFDLFWFFYNARKSYIRVSVLKANSYKRFLYNFIITLCTTLIRTEKKFILCKKNTIMV